MSERILHMVWLGERPEWVSESVQRWYSALPPGWELKLWTHRNAPGLEVIQEVAGHLSVRAQADLVRIRAVHEHGGVYVDTDTIPLRTTDLQRAGDWIGAKPVPETVTLINAHFGFEKGSEFLEALWDEAMDRIDRGMTNDHWVAGPRTWRAVYDRFSDRPPLIHRFPTITQGPLPRQLASGAVLDLHSLRQEYPHASLLHVIYSRKHAR